MKYVYVILCSIVLSACASKGGSPVYTSVDNPLSNPPTQTGTTTPPPIVAYPPAAPPTSTSLQLVVYTDAVAFGNPLQYMTGHCTIYKNTTYCWDNGWLNYLTQGYQTYFHIASFNGAAPKTYSQTGTNILGWTDPLANKPTANLADPTNVFNNGAMTSETCIESASAVTCETFQIDL